MEKEMLITSEGLKKLEEELEEAKTIKRREVAERIKQALAFGDISENSEYDEAKNEQAWLEERISKLESMLRNAKVIDEDDLSKDVVNVGLKVSLEDLDYNEKFEYTIVGSAEADPCEGKISNESPVGKALIGKKVDDIVSVEVPDGIARYKVLSIDK